MSVGIISYLVLIMLMDVEIFELILFEKNHLP